MARERTVIDEKLCRQVKLLLAGGATGREAARLTNTSTGTVSRIKTAGFDYQTFIANKEKRKEAPEKPEELQGQIRMEIEDPEEEKKEMSEQTKMMRFQAHEADQIMKKMEEQAVMICTKLDRLNDTISMILRAVRRD